MSKQFFVTHPETGRRHGFRLFGDKQIEWSNGQCAIVAADREAYAYTHGGSLYQLACERVWKARA
jgi:hypothetical protein